MVSELYRRRVLAAPIFLCLLSLVGFPGYGQSQADNPDLPIKQTLAWEKIEDALRYEITVIDQKGKQVFQSSVETASIDLQLGPGTYRYKIAVFNVLDRVAAETPWQSLVILKAETPVAFNMSPPTLYLENPVLTFSIAGRELVDGASYLIYRQDNPSIKATGTVVSRRGDQGVDLRFPDFEFSYGDYNLVIENPGGRRFTLKKALMVRYERPVDFLVSVGWAPMIVVYDPWYVSTWNQGPYPLAAEARIALAFIKRTEYRIGVEVDASAWKQTGGITAAVINSQYLSGGVNVDFTRMFTKQFALVARLGGGLILGNHGFDYQGTSGPTWTSADPYVALGASASFTVGNFLFFEAGANLMNGFGNAYQMGFVRPTVSVGVLF
jgi:hypothetical protein